MLGSSEHAGEARHPRALCCKATVLNVPNAAVLLDPLLSVYLNHRELHRVNSCGFLQPSLLSCVI